MSQTFDAFFSRIITSLDIYQSERTQIHCKFITSQYHSFSVTQQNIESYDAVPDFVNCDFTLVCRGDSMINAAILSGDLVVVRPQQSADDGQIVVARIGDEATVKRLRRRGGQVWLLPENPAYAPIDGTEAEIIGIVKALCREY